MMGLGKGGSDLKNMAIFGIYVKFLGGNSIYNWIRDPVKGKNYGKNLKQLKL